MSRCWLCGNVTREMSGGFAFGDRAADFGYLDRFRNAGQFQEFEQDPGRIELIPRKAMTCRSRMRMVIVMPALSERDQRHPPVVSRVIARLEPPLTPHMRGGVHQPCGVKTECHAEA